MIFNFDALLILHLLDKSVHCPRFVPNGTTNRCMHFPRHVSLCYYNEIGNPYCKDCENQHPTG